MPSHHAFRIMEDFTETTPRELRGRLLIALSQRKPFQQFKYIVDNSGEWRERWFAFRDEHYQTWVRQEFEFALKYGDEEE